MKKREARRKAQPRNKKARSRAERQPQVPRQLPRRQSPPPLQQAGRRVLGPTRGRVDWTALAILLVPLSILVLLALNERAPRKAAQVPLPTPEVSLRDSSEVLVPWHGDLTLEAMSVAPDTRSHMAVVDAEPLPMPWHGDLALEDMPVVPDARTRAAIAPIVPPEPVVAIASVTGRADTATAPMPICLPPQPSVLSVAPRGDTDVSSQHPAQFGRALAAAARAQLDEFVIYNPRYVTLAYPGGDTQSLYGVCTDVVVRAYRAFGIDFQELIHTSRLGRGDPSIDHRRVEVVRRFLERYGTSFEISDFPEDYLAGDIVTYQRPQGRVSQYHIAVVSDQLAPSGRPLIVHNRGWGPQHEDALFVDRITGHYRFSPADAEAFMRTRQPQAAGRHRTADVASPKGR